MCRSNQKLAPFLAPGIYSNIDKVDYVIQYPLLSQAR